MLKSYLSMGWIGTLKAPLLWAPLCGANKERFTKCNFLAENSCKLAVCPWGPRWGSVQPSAKELRSWVSEYLQMRPRPPWDPDHISLMNLPLCISRLLYEMRMWQNHFLGRVSTPIIVRSFAYSIHYWTLTSLTGMLPLWAMLWVKVGFG